ncbi:hypothetical protein F5B22DRAFT_648918 [Xylaria bambusicola]|uniref:uncharacterized protein n=1 Tax=Xylaria bambusicola TaxID=326684 RepID=UPI00200891B2|nr:uncharacterized protein F5B22DRAFT_648918 [Xylaria bambusicola]KAI0509491.1 hypothetical protein F5B22DRAFT_648918 [Xylaria bambusicola]
MLNTRDERDSEVNNEELPLKKSRKGKEPEGLPSKKSRTGKEPEGLSGKKRPMNAFILFRNARGQEVRAKYPRFKTRNGIISKIIAIMWAAMTDAEQQPWFDEYLQLRRLEPDFKDVNGRQNSRRRKLRKEADRLKAVAQLQLIQQQYSNGEELTFSEGPSEMAQSQEEAQIQLGTPLNNLDDPNEMLQGHEQAEVQLGTPLGDINERPAELAQTLDVLPRPAGFVVEANRDLDFNSTPDAAFNPQVNQHPDHQHEATAHHESPIDDLRLFGQDLEFIFDMGKCFDFNKE